MFELDGDNGPQLFVSRVLGVGENQPVDIAVDGVFRLTLRVRAVSSTWARRLGRRPDPQLQRHGVLRPRAAGRTGVMIPVARGRAGRGGG